MASRAAGVPSTPVTFISPPRPLAFKAWSGEIKPYLMSRRQRAFYTDSVLVDQAGLDGYRRNFILNPPDYDYNDLEFPIGRAMKID